MLAAAATAPDCSAYATLQEWNGRVHYTWSAQYTLDTIIVQRNHDASVNVHLARVTPDVPGATWIAFEGPGVGTVKGPLVFWERAAVPNAEPSLAVFRQSA